MIKMCFKLTLSLFIITTLFTGCSKDEETPKSSITYDGKSYTLPSAELSVDDEFTIGDETVYSIELNLYNEDLFNLADVHFSLISTSPSIAPGDYTYLDGSLSATTWSYGYGWGIFGTVNLTSGSLKVEKSGTTYTINFIGKTDEDEDVKIYYKGAIEADPS